MNSNDISYFEKLSLLKAQMSLQFGQRIVNYNDCNGLSEEVFKKTGKLISSQTFRRFFKLIKSESMISQLTADILCVYCGYLNLDHLVSKQSALGNSQTTQYHEAQIYKTFFEGVVPKIAKGEVNHVYLDALNRLLKRVFADKLLYDTLIPLVSRNPTAHNYLFEQFPFIDGFGRGFEQGYSLYIRHKPELEAQVFGNAMLFLSSVLQNDLTSAKVYHDIICSFNLESIKHPFVIARYMGTQILYHHLMGDMDEKQSWITLVKNKLIDNVNLHGFQYFNIEFELMISEYLILTESFKLVIDILLPVYNNKELIAKDIDTSFWIMPIKIMLIRSFTYTNRLREAKELIPKVAKINWLVDDYFSIQLLDAKRKISVNEAERIAIGRDLKRLISKTKFKYFEPFLKQ